MQPATSPAPAAPGAAPVARRGLAAAATTLVAEIDARLDTADLAGADPLLDRLRACDPLALARPAQDEVLRCWARTVDERIGRAEVPAAVVDEDLTMLDALRSAAGRGPGPVPLLRLRWARLRGDAQAAAAAADLLRMHGARDWEDADRAAAEAAAVDPGTPPPDRARPGERCRACELSEYGNRLADRRHHAAAARTLLAAASAAPGTCCDEPARALARALVPLVEAGRTDDARAAFAAGCSVRSAPGDVLGLRLHFLARSGNAALGLRLLAEHAAVPAREPRTDRRLAALTGAAVLLDAVRSAGHGSTAVTAPDGGTASATELAREFRLEAQRLARVLDRRHDSDHLARLTDDQFDTGRRGTRRGRHRRLRARAELPADRLPLALGEPVLPAGPRALPAPAYRQPPMRGISADELHTALDRAERLLAARHPQAEEAWEHAAEAARRSPAATGPQERARVDAGLGELAALGGRLDRGADLLDRARHAQHGTRAASTTARLGETLVRFGDTTRGHALLDSAIAALADPSRDTAAPAPPPPDVTGTFRADPTRPRAAAVPVPPVPHEHAAGAVQPPADGSRRRTRAPDAAGDAARPGEPAGTRAPQTGAEHRPPTGEAGRAPIPAGGSGRPAAGAAAAGTVPAHGRDGDPHGRDGGCAGPGPRAGKAGTGRAADPPPESTRGGPREPVRDRPEPLADAAPADDGDPAGGAVSDRAPGTARRTGTGPDPDGGLPGEPRPTGNGPATGTRAADGATPAPGEDHGTGTGPAAPAANAPGGTPFPYRRGHRPAGPDGAVCPPASRTGHRPAADGPGAAAGGGPAVRAARGGARTGEPRADAAAAPGRPGPGAPGESLRSGGPGTRADRAGDDRAGDDRWGEPRGAAATTPADPPTAGHRAAPAAARPARTARTSPAAGTGRPRVTEARRLPDLGPAVRIRPDQGAGPGAVDRTAGEGGDPERRRPATTRRDTVPGHASPGRSERQDLGPGTPPFPPRAAQSGPAAAGHGREGDPAGDGRGRSADAAAASRADRRAPSTARAAGSTPADAASPASPPAVLGPEAAAARRKTVRVTAERTAEKLPAADAAVLVRALRGRALARAGAADDPLPAPAPIEAADRDDVRADLELAARIAFRHRLHTEEAMIYAARANLLHADEPEQAERLLRDAERLWIRLGHGWQLSGAAHWIGLCAEALGRHGDAAEAQARSQQLALRHPQPQLLRRALFAQLRAVAAEGRHRDAVPVGLAATVALEEAGERSQAALARRLLGAALLELGRLREAAGYLAAALPELDASDPAGRTTRAECRLDLAAAHLATGDREAAVTHYGFASQDLERAGAHRRAADAAGLTGDVLRSLGRDGLAVRAYLHAADLLGRGPGEDLAAAGRARWTAAGVLAEGGEVAAAAVALTRAWYDVRAAGDAPDAATRDLRERIERDLAELQGRPGPG